MLCDEFILYYQIILYTYVGKEEIENYSKSWDKSFAESQRLVDYVMSIEAQSV